MMYFGRDLYLMVEIDHSGFNRQGLKRVIGSFLVEFLISRRVFGFAILGRQIKCFVVLVFARREFFFIFGISETLDDFTSRALLLLTLINVFKDLIALHSISAFVPWLPEVLFVFIAIEHFSLKRVE